MCDECIANIAARATFVVDDDLLTPNRGEPFCYDSRVGVGWPARRKRYDHVNGSIGPSISVAARTRLDANADAAPNAIK